MCTYTRANNTKKTHKLTFEAENILVCDKMHSVVASGS